MQYDNTIANIMQSHQNYTAWNSLQDAACKAKQRSTDDSSDFELSASQNSMACTVANDSVNFEDDTSDYEDESSTSQLEMNMESVQHQLDQEELQELRYISQMDAQIINAVLQSQQARKHLISQITKMKTENTSLRSQVKVLTHALAEK